jgi:flavin reductase (DIM6/NTAB) family NADH-FMN oxidoreductase RutF
VTQFKSVRRQQFRRFFQPSRILLGIVPAPVESKFNVITLCFSMHCSYKPPMIAIAVNARSCTYELIQQCSEFVLSVPGPSLVDATLYCGVRSLKEGDKIKELSLELVDSETIAVPGLLRAIANVELRKSSALEVGDHLLVVGEVCRFAINAERQELPLLSVGPYTNGYNVLRKKGIHRLATVKSLEITPNELK